MKKTIRAGFCFYLILLSLAILLSSCEKIGGVSTLPSVTSAETAEAALPETTEIETSLLLFSR